MTKFFIIMSCLLFFTLDPATHTVSTGSQTEDKVIPYKVLSNKILYSTRSIDILIDEKDFTVDNLKILMSHFFEDYPHTKRISVFVATDSSQIGDLAEYSDPTQRPGALHPCGGLFRQNDKEFIRYRLPNERMQTIIIKE